MRNLVVFAVLSFVAQTYCAKVREICCERIGCYTIDKAHPMWHLPDPSCPDDIKLKFILFTRESRDFNNIISTETLPDTYDPKKLTIFTSHGWMGEADMGWMNDLVKSLLDKYDANVIAADWKKGSHKVYYPYAAANVLTVGGDMAYLMTHLVTQRGDDFSSMWCIGFSLGAHVCGHAGMQTGGKLSRVTGLDPAGPSFHDRNVLNGINPTSGQFVDILHSDGGGIVSYYGLIEPRGHADFYPNGGRDQPGCYFGRKKRDLHVVPSQDWMSKMEDGVIPYNPFIGCDHYRAVHYFLDTLSVQDCHMARYICPDTDKKMPKHCSLLSEPVEMGVDADRTQRGLFYLETGKKKPYCRY